MPRASISMLLLVLAIAGIAGAYAVGSQRASTPVTVARPESAPVRPATSVPKPKATVAPAAPVMDAAAFWNLMGDTRAAAGNDTGRQSELIDTRLRRLPPQQIATFQRIYRSLDRRAYTWDLWGAAYVVEDGCSDDCFRDFRAYLISLGRGPYETALRDPDALAGTVQDAETGDWENADDVAPDAYQSVTGQDIPGDSSDLSGNPRGTPWDEDQAEALVQRYPRLAARFR